MSINLRTSGPSYSTDATAHAVSGFIANRAQLSASEERAAVTTPTRPFA